MKSPEEDKRLKRLAQEAGCAGLIRGWALNLQTGRKFYANSAFKSDGPFYCPECYSDAVVRKCVDKTDHFAHVARLSPILSEGESALHDECKKAICSHLAERFPDGKWATERPIPANETLGVQKLVPDVSGNINGFRVAIEIQLSQISLSQIIKRTTAYTKRKIAILWVVPLHEPLGDEPFRPRQFEKYLHMMYYGRLYYWWPDLGANIMPVHFTQTKREIPHAEWYEDGELRDAGGYEKTYKTIKLPNYGRMLSVSKDFAASHRASFVPDNEKKSVPSCLIWRDVLSPWWDDEVELIEQGDFSTTTI